MRDGRRLARGRAPASSSITISIGWCRASRRFTRRLRQERHCPAALPERLELARPELAGARCPSLGEAGPDADLSEAHFGHPQRCRGALGGVHNRVAGLSPGSIDEEIARAAVLTIVAAAPVRQ